MLAGHRIKIHIHINAVHPKPFDTTLSVGKWLHGAGSDSKPARQNLWKRATSIEHRVHLGFKLNLNPAELRAAQFKC
jgi:hypothetical protein